MNHNLIRELVRIVEESNISELEVTRWGKKVRILKQSNHTLPSQPIHVEKNVVPVQPTVVETPPEPTPAPPKVEPSPAPVQAEVKSNKEEIRCPMVGTFYRSPAPDADPYVQVGDRVGPGKVLCIVEAMKLMNEIEAEISGKIVEIMVENGQPVEYNQPLFLIELD